MQNVFDRGQYPSREPQTAVAGDRWVWRRSDIAATYPTAGFDLLYRFTNQSAPASTHDVDATKSDGDFFIEIESSTTVQFFAGAYAWEAVVTRLSDNAEAIVDRGFIEVTDAATAGHTLVVLLAIRATLEGTATSDQQRIEVGGRVLERRSVEDLLRLEKEYARRWRNEKEQALRSSGRKVSRTLIGLRA